MVLAAIGITLGYHRYFSHKEFKASPLAEIVMLYCGLLCGGRSALTWVGVHRMHHAYADTPQDPHSPQYNPWWRILFSMWRVESIPRKFIKDLISNERIIFFHRFGPYVLIVTYMVLYLIFSWGAIVSLLGVSLLSYLGFGILNLYGHNSDGPVNRIWINLLAPFEGNHKDHHVSSNNKRDR